MLSATNKTRTNLLAESRGFGLPRTDLLALQIDAVLRSARADFISSRDYDGDVSSTTQLPVVVVRDLADHSKSTVPLAGGGDNGPQIATNIPQVLDLLQRSGHPLLDEPPGSSSSMSSSSAAIRLSEERKALTLAVRHAADTVAQPAYDYLTIALPEHYRIRRGNGLHRNVSGANSSSWGGLAGTITDAASIVTTPLQWLLGTTSRDEHLAQLARAHRGLTSVATACDLAQESLEELELVLRALSYNSTSGSSSGRHHFAFGHERPTTIDCIIFACGAGFLLAEWPAKQATSLRQWQHHARGQFPLVLLLTESVRSFLYGNNTQFRYFALRPIPPSLMSSSGGSGSSFDTDRLYRDGRSTVIGSTIAFTVFYFMVSNAGLIVQLLEAYIAEEEAAESDLDTLMNSQGEDERKGEEESEGAQQ